VVFFDGQSGHVTLPGKVIDGVSDATIETWVKWESFTKWSRVFDFGKEGNAIVVQTEKKSSTLNFALYDRNSKRYRVQKRKVIELGVWYHIAAVCGKQGLAFYINGELAGVDDRFDGGLNEVAGGNNYIGKSNWDGDKFFHGYVSEFRIWDEAKDQTEIRAVMKTQLKGTEPHLIGYWRFDKTDGNIVRDLSTRGNHVVLTGKAILMAQERPPIILKKTLAELLLIPGMGAYRAMVLDAYRDGKIVSEERQVLKSAQSAKNLSEGGTVQIEMDILQALFSGPVEENETIYYAILEKIYADEKVSPNEQLVLDATKFRLGLSDERSKILIGAYHLTKTSN
jgi:hypothetical protein